MGRLETTATALVAWLNDVARSWPMSFTAVLSWTPEVDLKNLDAALLVEVIPEGLSGTGGLASRGSRSRTFTHVINVRQKYEDESGPVPAAWIAARVELIEAIEGKLVEFTLTGQPSGTICYVGAVSLDPVYDLLSLLGPRVFDSLIEVTVEEVRQR